MVEEVSQGILVAAQVPGRGLSGSVNCIDNFHLNTPLQKQYGDFKRTFVATCHILCTVNNPRAMKQKMSTQTVQQPIKVFATVTDDHQTLNISRYDNSGHSQQQFQKVKIFGEETENQIASFCFKKQQNGSKYSERIINTNVWCGKFDEIDSNLDKNMNTDKKNDQVVEKVSLEKGRIRSNNISAKLTQGSINNHDENEVCRLTSESPNPSPVINLGKENNNSVLKIASNISIKEGEFWLSENSGKSTLNETMMLGDSLKKCCRDFIESSKAYLQNDVTPSVENIDNRIVPESDPDLPISIEENSDFQQEKKSQECCLTSETFSLCIFLALDNVEDLTLLKAYIERCSVDPATRWNSTSIANEIETKVKREHVDILNDLLGNEQALDRERLSLLPVPLSEVRENELIQLALTQLENLPDYEILKIFRMKLRYCCINGIRRDHSHYKEFKQILLTDIIGFFHNVRVQPVLSDDVTFRDIVTMIKCNIFRPLKLEQGEGFKAVNLGDCGRSNCFDDTENLFMIYEILLLLVDAEFIPLSTKKQCFDERFCTDIIQNFTSPNARERDLVKTITHSLYSKIVSNRVCMRRAMTNTFFGAMYDKKGQCNPTGVAEILEVYGSIVSGFVRPLKEEHKKMLLQCLIPLHGVRGSEYFHEQLVFVLVQFISKDPNMVVPVISGILRYWPSRNATKQVLYMSEIEEMLNYMQPDHFRFVRDRLIRRLCSCIESGHFQVAEYAMALLNSEFLYAMVFNNDEVRKRLLPSIVAALKNALKSWSKIVRQVAEDILKFLEDDSIE